MRPLPFLPMLLLAAPAAAQTPSAAPQAPQVTPGAPRAPQSPSAFETAPWDPAASYISAGQDLNGYKSWYLAAPWREEQVKSFYSYLVSGEVAGIVPTWQLFRTATSWQECGAQPFEVPPTSEWPHIIQTLRYIRDYVIPAVGPVEPVSVYRNPVLNQCAGGAPESAHKQDSAIDLVPLKPISREALIKTLCDDHTKHGAAYAAGLGFYAFVRFHIDSVKFRRWNMDPAVLALCPPIVHPADVASVGQPVPPPPTPPADPAVPQPQTAPQAQHH